MKKGLLKQAFAMFLAVTMLVTSLPVTAYADTDVKVTKMENEEKVVETEAAVAVDSEVKLEERASEFKVTDIKLSKKVLTINESDPTDKITVRAYTTGSAAFEYLTVLFGSDASYSAVAVVMTKEKAGEWKGEITASSWMFVPDGTYYLTEVVGPGAASEYYESLSIKIVREEEAKEVAITFNTNGGNELSKKEAKKSVEVGEKLGTLPTPTRKGYKFNGWNTKADGSGIKVTADSTALVAMTVYAQWTAIKYDIKFHANGGKGTMATKEDVKYTTKVTLTNKFTRKGYTFAGWAKSKNGDVVYKNKQEVSKLTSKNGATVDLYAKWTKNKYTIKFKANGGKGTMDAQKNIAYDKKVKLTNKFTRKGYTFAGWATSKNGKVVYKNKQEVSKLTSEKGGTVTLYAKWTKNKYTIKFKANGGKGTMKAQKDIAYDKKVKLTNKFTKKGYKFAGWATSKKGKVVYKNKQEVSKLTSEKGGTVTLYAIWKKK